MDPKTFSVKLALFSSLISIGGAYAQGLPDEVNHPRYLQIYQGLDATFQQKVSEHQRLSSQKSEIEKTIAQMEKDLREIPARNAELTQVISAKRAEVANLEREISQVEQVLGQVVADLQRLDGMITQLNRDLGEQSNRLRSIDAARIQANQTVAAHRARLDRELREEAETARNLERLNNDFNQANQQRAENERERRELNRDVTEARRDLPNFKAAVQQNTILLGNKKPVLADLQSKLPAIKADVSNQEAKVNAAEANLAPERTKLNQQTVRLNNLNSQIAALTTENTQLQAKITQNRTRIGNMNNAALVEARTRLEQEVAALTTQTAALRASRSEVEGNLSTKRTELEQKKVELRQYTPRTADFARVAREIAQINDEIERLEDQKKRLDRQLAPSDALIASKNQQIAQYNAAIISNDLNREALQKEIAEAEVKITENTQAKAVKENERATALQAVSAQQATVSALEAQKTEASRELARARTLQNQVEGQINTTSAEVQRLERDIAQANTRITQMESLIASYPQTIQRLENHNRMLENRMNEARRDITTNERLLSRIQQDRVEIQRVYDAEAQRLEAINRDYSQTDAQVRMLQGRVAETQRERETLARYNQDSIRKYDHLKASKAAAEKEIADATQETNINNQDLATIGTELPKLRSDLAAVSPRVATALAARNDAETRAQTASTDYQNRRSLYDRYLSEAKSLGQERGIIGSQEGARDGESAAVFSARDLGTQSGTAEGKWEAMRRGYVRGEIAGFDAGFEVGRTSVADASRGEAEGKLAGKKRAENEANMVKKPEIYLQILADRLVNDDPSKKKLVSEISSKASSIHAFQSEIPELGRDEIQRSQEILSSLDALINQTEVELRKVRDLQNRTRDSRNVYHAPTQVPGAQNGDCSGVYKNVKDFSDACKASFSARYQSLYGSSHAQAFHSAFGGLFNTAVERAASVELLRQYAGFEAEARRIGREVGVSAGKEEIYKQSFASAEANSYNESAPREEARVTNEAQDLVQDYLAKNPALAQKGEAKLQGELSPGASGSIVLALKNIGNLDSGNTSLIRVKEVSSNIILEQRESVIPSLAGRSQKEISLLQLKVSDVAVPGSRALISGEIVHPGNHYRATRTETFRIDKTLGVNADAAINVDFDADPKISGFFGGTNTHKIEVAVSPKYAGVSGGYSVTLEEVGGRNAELVTSSASTGELSRGAVKTVILSYKLRKDAKGKQVTLRVKVMNGETVVKTMDLAIVPK